MVLHSITNVQVLSYFFIGLSAGFRVVALAVALVVDLTVVVAFAVAFAVLVTVIGFSVGSEMSAAVDDVDATEVIAVVSGFSLSGKVFEEMSVTVVAGVV